jgi:hypothetical protein
MSQMLRICDIKESYVKEMGAIHINFFDIIYLVPAEGFGTHIFAD